MNTFKIVTGALLLICFITIIGLTSYIFLNNDNTDHQEEYHIHAGFIVIKDDEVFDFGDIKYMHAGTCGDQHYADDLSEEEEQFEKAHLHDLNGDVVHVHRKGATWGDLFQNINFEFSDNIFTYRDSEKIENILDKEIEPYEQIMIFDGNDGDFDDFREELPSYSRIVEVENTAESCSAS